MQHTAKTKDVATRYKLSAAYIRDLARFKKLPAKRVGGQWRFNMEEVESVLVRESEPSINEIIGDI